MLEERSQKAIDQLNYEKKMSDLNYQIEIANAKRVNETAKQKKKTEYGGLTSYMSTPQDGNLPHIGE